MRFRFATVSGLCATLCATAIGLGGPALADDSDSWTMPDVRGKTLQQALNKVAGLSSSEVIPTGAVDMTRWGRQIMSPANWTVCATAPGPGGTVTVRNGVLFGVVRHQSESC